MEDQRKRKNPARIFFVFCKDLLWEAFMLVFHPGRAYFATVWVASLWGWFHRKQIRRLRRAAEALDAANSPQFMFRDVTFVIPVKFDSEERRVNLKRTLEFIRKYFDTNTLVVEEGFDRRFEDLAETGAYLFVKAESDVFHKTKLINAAVEKTSTPYFVIQDADVLPDPTALVLGRELIIRKAADIVHVCLGVQLTEPKDVPGVLNPGMKYSLFRENDFAKAYKWEGLAVLFDRKIFFEGGGANEKFVSWGWEDSEMHFRFKKLGCKLQWLPFSAIHLWHPKGVSANRHNEKEYLKIRKMNRKQVEAYVKSTLRRPAVKNAVDAAL